MKITNWDLTRRVTNILDLMQGQVWISLAAKLYLFKKVFTKFDKLIYDQLTEILRDVSAVSVCNILTVF